MTLDRVLAVYRIFEEEHPDVLVNFAAESHVDRSIEHPEVFLQTNIIGTAVMMDACRKFGISRYHQVSTDEVYGDLPLNRPDLFFTEENSTSYQQSLQQFQSIGGFAGFGLLQNIWPAGDCQPLQQ